MMNTRYILGATVAVPLLPLMYYQGQQIRASVPVLPEATGIEGYVQIDSTKEVSLLAIGESTIAGVGVKTHREGFTGTLAQEIGDQLGVNVRWKVYAKSGYTAKKVTEKILPKITENEVDIIVVGLDPLPNVYYSLEKITLDGWMKKFQVDTEMSEFFSDGVHPSLFTYQTWARDLADFILKDEKIVV